MPVRPQERTAAAVARRAQIIAATIETLAEVGYRRTTFARIAKHGGLSSTRLISYHFAGKNELVKAVVADIYASIDEFLAERAASEPASRPIRQPEGLSQQPPAASARDELRAYLTGVVAFVDGNRVRMRALQSVYAALHDEEGSEEAKGAAYDAATDRGVLDHIRGILRRGQEGGEFREFDTLVMAAAIQRSLNGLPLLLRTDPGLDLAVCAEELVTLFDLATRARETP